MDDHVTVLVVGGGPAGSTAAALLADAGLQVRLLEKTVFPRYHIGESLVLSCVPVLKASGAFEKVKAHGFQVKRGSVFRWVVDDWVIDWAKMVGPDAYAWQVDRAEFDHVLLRHAADKGAEVVEGAAAKNVLFDGDRPVAVEWTQDGEPHTTRFDFLVDASGRAGLLANQHFKFRRQHEVFQNIATWGYWQGAKTLPESPEGSVNSISTADGWFWAIPLANGEVSLGYVTHKKIFQQQRATASTLEDFYFDKVANDPTIQSLVHDAECVSQIRAEQDYSYVADRFCGPGYVIVGDAACFLDPLLSTGVHLALYSAFLASASVAAALHRDVAETEALKFFEYIFRRAYCRLLVLVSRMYGRHGEKDQFFWQAQRLNVTTEQGPSPLSSFMEVSAGTTDMREIGDADTRVLTETLMREAETAQDQAVQNFIAGSLDATMRLNVEPLRELLDGLVGSDTPTALEDMYVTDTPRLGLARRPPVSSS